ncbi:MAG: 30S ribosomal protein S20 [Gemmataceae bacterium]|nr:30S ribosomal protein S20 [Gemmataceae bacterium]
MPHTSSAAKRARQYEKRRDRNQFVKRGVKIQTRLANEALAEGAGDQAQAQIKLAFKKIDKAAARGVLHKNTAARRKSKLARAANAAKTKLAAEAK